MAVLTAQWPAPPRVRTLISLRQQGASQSVYANNNLALHVGDDPSQVATNRDRLLASASGATTIQWLHQTHSTHIVTATEVEVDVGCKEAADADAGVAADGCITRQPGLACAVLTADCLPILLCDAGGTQVAAVHAGWRGLAAGILTDALSLFTAEAGDILVYLGPAISQKHFEVGVEVKSAFLDSAWAQLQGSKYKSAVKAAFVPSSGGRLRADLYSLARSQCQSMGVTQIYGGEYCTFDDPQRFYSYRRDGRTGRMASLIWLA